MPSTLKPMNQLPIKHQLFILGYLEHKGDKTKAARHAGYAPKRATEQGSQLYRKLQVYIDPLTKNMVQAYALSAEQVVQGLSLIASSNIRDYMRWGRTSGVRMVNADQLTPQQAYCVEEVIQTVTKDGERSVRFKLQNKHAALDSLAKYHNLFRRTPASKGLFVSFEDGTIHSGGTKATREVQEHTRRKVEVTFESVPPGPTMKKGNGHGHG